LIDRNPLSPPFLDAIKVPEGKIKRRGYVVREGNLFEYDSREFVPC